MHLSSAGAVAVAANPLGKVLELIDELRAKVVKDGEAEAKAFKEYFEWCSAEKKISYPTWPGFFEPEADLKLGLRFCSFPPWTLDGCRVAERGIGGAGCGCHLGTLDRYRSSGGKVSQRQL
jgi:hypothetical protein